MPPRRPHPTRLAAAALVAALLLVAAAATVLPEAPLRIVAPLAAHAIHLVAAFVLGRAILRIPGAAPREALDVIVSSVAAGLVGLSLLTLTGALLLGCGWWLPWAVDAVALVAGAIFGRLREASMRVLEPWERRDMAVVVASRLPLHLALCLVAVLHVIPPFLPPAPATGAAELGLVSQAALRGDLASAALALPETFVSPSQGLLLLGWMTGGSQGALLFGATALALLAAAAWLHAHRHLGEIAAAWTALVVLSVPLLLPATARSPSLELLLLFGFLAFHEVADWCQRATGGKIALAAIFGGMLAAESPRGLAAFAAVLVFLFLVQALIDRNGILRQVPGLLGMTGIALLVALPFLAISCSLPPAPAMSVLGERYVPEPLREMAGLPERAPGSQAPSPARGDDGSLTDASLAEATSPGEIAASLARTALLLGPLLLGLLAVLPLVPLPPEPLRHAVVGALLFAAAAMLPRPYGGAVALLIVPAALAAAATAASLVAQRGIVGRAGAAFVILALPASVAMGLALGPDIPFGAGLLLGRVTPEEYVTRHVPDEVLVSAVRARGITDGKALLLVGSVTDVHYPARVVRAPDLGAGTTLDALAASPHGVEAVAVDRLSASPAALTELADRVVLAEAGHGRWALMSVQRKEAPPAEAAPAEPVAAPAAEPAAGAAGEPAPEPKLEPAPEKPAPTAPKPRRGTRSSRPRSR